MSPLLVLGIFSVLRSCYSEAPVSKVCYQHVGCFSIDPPFNNSIGYLPQSPEYLDVQFKLFTRENPDTSDYLNYTVASSIDDSHFNAKLPVKIIIHGFLSGAKDNWVTKTKDEILKKENVNVINIDWSKGANTIEYNQAVADIRVVATEIKLLIQLFEGVSLENVHIIGHSLGAHTAGYIGQMLGSKIGRISALEPAKLGFQNVPSVVRVDRSDAKFVDAIHTDAGPYTLLGANGGLGLKEPVGHVDFYVNGGEKQPGCKTPYETLLDIIGKKKRGVAQVFACNHVRSHELYTESINSPCKLRSYPCENYAQFKRGECASCTGQGCNVMGYSADKYPGRGKLYLDTFDKKPFCGYQYKFVANLAIPASNVAGKLSFSLIAEDKSMTTQGVIKTSDAKIEGSSIQGVILLDKQPSTVIYINVRFKKSADYMTSSFVINDLEITSLETNAVHKSDPGTYSISQGRYGTNIRVGDDNVPIG